jgi:transcription elongation factor Elf1
MEDRKIWIKIAIEFAENPLVSIQCPSCNNGNLKSWDISLDEKGRKERIIYCEHCNRYEAMLLNK